MHEDFDHRVLWQMRIAESVFEGRLPLQLSGAESGAFLTCVAFFWYDLTAGTT